MKGLLAVLGAGIVATGCATTQAPMPESVKTYEYKADQSLALNVMQSAGFEGLTDLPREDYEAMVEENPELRGIDPRRFNEDGSAAVRYAGAGVVGVAGALDPIAEIGSLGTGLLDAAFFLSPDKLKANQQNQRIVWLPDGVTLEDYEREMVEAYYRVYGSGDVPLEVTYKDWMFSGKQATAGTPECVTDDPSEINTDCAVVLHDAVYALNPRTDFIDREDFELPALRSTPEYIEGMESAKGPVISDFWIDAPDDMRRDIDNFLSKVSAQSPDYVYFYVARISNQPVTPRIYHDGRVHYFIEP